MFSFHLVELRPGFCNMCSDTGMAKRDSLSITGSNGHLTSSAYFFSCQCLLHMIFHDMSIYFLKEVRRGTRELTVRCRIDSVSWVDLPQLWPCVEISLYPAWGVWGRARVKVHLGGPCEPRVNPLRKLCFGSLLSCSRGPRISGRPHTFSGIL